MYTECLDLVSKDSLSKAHEHLQRAARLLQQGKLVAMPTETTYGLGASILNQSALQNLYKVKNRDHSKPLPVQVANFDQLKFIVRDLPSQFKKIADRFLPGPLTVILKKNRSLSDVITGEKGSVAIRISSNPIVKKIIELTGCPLAMPSANLSGRPSSIFAKHVLEDLNGKIEVIIDGGETEFGFESTVISLENPEKPVLMRHGVILQHELEGVLESPLYIHSQALLSHYRTDRTKTFPAVRLFSSWDEMNIYLQLSNQNKRLIMSLENPSKTIVMRDFFKLTDKNLYEGLRVALRNGYAEILVLYAPSLKKSGLLYKRLKQIAIT